MSNKYWPQKMSVMPMFVVGRELYLLRIEVLHFLRG